MPELSGDEEEVYRNFGVIRGFGLNGGGGGDLPKLWCAQQGVC